MSGHHRGSLGPDEIIQACELFKTVFGHETTAGVWRWKYQLGPRLGSLNVVVRDVSGGLLGHAGALVFPGQSASGPLPMAQVCDVMVHPLARGGVNQAGVYGSLMTGLQEGLQTSFPGVYAYGFAGVRPFKLGARMGLYRCVQECRWGHMQSSAVPSLELSVFSTPWRQLSKRLWPWKPRTSWQAVTWEEAAPALDDLWQRCSARTVGPTVSRTADYLKWRYGTHPVHRYQLWLEHSQRWQLWGRHSEVQGWVVTRAMPSGEVCIVDSMLPAHLTFEKPLGGLSAAWRQLLVSSQEASSYPASSSFSAWFLHTPASLSQEPVMGCEVRVRGWRDDLATPTFQPGDTDVF